MAPAQKTKAPKPNKADENTAGGRNRVPTKRLAETKAAEVQKKAAPAAGTKHAQANDIARLKERINILQGMCSLITHVM